MILSVEAVSEKLQKLGYDQAKVMKFLAWYTSRPKAWRYFEKIALDLIGAGRKAGAIDILGKIRWDCEIMGSDDFKCNNDYAPMLARVFAMKHPQHEDFFEFRKAGEK